MAAKFWMVVGRGVPYFKHATEESADREAARLAVLCPGESFTVLEAIRTAVRQDVRWEENDGILGVPDLPF